jgi:hypothetical protein
MHNISGYSSGVGENRKAEEGWISITQVLKLPDGAACLGTAVTVRLRNHAGP